MRMMAATTAGKRDKNNELCVQIWRRAERRSSGKRDEQKKNYKLCYNNNRIDNNNFVYGVCLSPALSRYFDKRNI